MWVDWHQEEMGNIAGMFHTYLLTAEEQWESVTLAPAPGCRGKCIHVFCLEPKLRSLRSCPYQSVLFSSLLQLLFLVQVFNVIFCRSSIKISTFVKFLADTFLMYRVRGTIDSAIEELIVQWRNHVPGLHNLKGFNTSMALPCIKYHTCAGKACISHFTDKWPLCVYFTTHTTNVQCSFLTGILLAQFWFFLYPN